MSETIANYVFLPWMRRGLATEIKRVDGSGPTAPRAQAPVTLKIGANQAPLLRDVTAKLTLFGSGEISSIDRRLIIRRYPAPLSHDVEPNYFPHIEFEQPDFLWRYTPARARANDRLRPWLVLVVLSNTEIAERHPAGGSDKLPWIKTTTAAFLPRLDQSWAWAHVQVSGVTDLQTEDLQKIADQEPARDLSRLLCPRRLAPQTRYTAFLVPAFERGRLAGLGKPVTDSIDGLTPAWTTSPAAVDLPVYDEWSFETGVKGDFESLTRKLRSRALPATVGVRPMDVSTPDPALPAAASSHLGLEGALMAPNAVSPSWDLSERSAFVPKLAELTNLRADLLEGNETDPLVAPPLYGNTYALQDRLAILNGYPSWFHEVNADPRLRTSSGLGTRVVQEQQEQLMAAAWDKVEGVLAMNALLRQAQLARELAKRLHERHIVPMPADALLAVTSPVHGRLRASNAVLASGSSGLGSAPQKTVHAMISQSPIPPGALQTAFRRVTRARGPVKRRQRRETIRPAAPLLERMNRGELRPDPAPRAPERAVTPEQASKGLAPAWIGDRARELLKVAHWIVLAIGLAVLLIALVLWLIGIPVPGLLWGAGAGLSAFSVLVARWARRVRVGSLIRDGLLSADDVQTAPIDPSYQPGLIPPGSNEPIAVATSPGTREQLRTAFVDLLTEWDQPPAPGPVLEPVDMPALASDVSAALAPEKTVVAALKPRWHLPDWVEWKPEDPLEPIMAAPEFERPMYEPLRDLSQEWLMPGVGQIPQNTTTLAITNQRFIEAYMLGLNHEMGRELLWREYPTDRRGTYFRQFWDSRGYVVEQGTAVVPEDLKDIVLLPQWHQLGDNTARKPPPGGDHLVLLVKGEVLRRYPRTMVYAVEATLDENKKRVLGTREKHPVFEGQLNPDIGFFGFELTPNEVHGDTDPSAHQGWFFVLQEQPTEPRFGLDLGETAGYGQAVATWNDLSWKHLATDEQSLKAVEYIDLDTTLPDTRNVVQPSGEPNVAWHANAGLGGHGATAADLAYIALQRPFRVARHGSDMLPE
ncbi:MAG: hypothetical protein QNJ97_07580 [Myxococcota bacterium]|nr:hypothetical protein [Myxococcota bacterium]